MICKKCGYQNADTDKFCGNCGESLEAYSDSYQSYAQSSYGTSYTQQQPVYSDNPNNIPSEYKPISMWGYFGYELLFSIPCIGFILLLVFSFGGTSNVNLKNFARSYFCFLIVLVLLFLLFVVVGGGFAALSYRW